MQDYDATLKSLLRSSPALTMRELAGAAVAQWLDVELPQVRNLRLDLLGETVDGDLVHVELQSGNDPSMPLRMAEYCLGIFRQFGRWPRQVLLYVGLPPMRMDSELRGSNAWFRYRLLDIRDLDGERLIESQASGDNVIAILARLRDDKEAVHRIARRIAGLAQAERETAIAQLTILAGLRNLEEIVEQEVRRMPIDADIMEHKVLGPRIREAELKGHQEGLQEGLHTGELTVLRRLLEKRFGPLPGWAPAKLAAMPAAQLEDLSERVLDARSLDELLR